MKSKVKAINKTGYNFTIVIFDTLIYNNIVTQTKSQNWMFLFYREFLSYRPYILISVKMRTPLCKDRRISGFA